MWISVIAKPNCPNYSTHQYLWSYFPGATKGEERPFLYRALDSSILMLSRVRPAIPGAVNVADRVQAGAVYQFDALVSARNGQNHKPGRPQKHRFIRDNDELRAWFSRRLSGAEPGFVQIFDRPDLRLTKASGHVIVRPQCVIRGTVKVNDRSEFLGCLARGVGGGGAWGLGLMVLPEVMNVR